MGEAFTRNLKALREDKGIKQYQLAEGCGLRAATVSLWETQNTQPRSPKVIKILCDFFNCDESDLFGYSDGYYAKTRGAFEQCDIKKDKTQLKKLEDGKSVYVPSRVVSNHPEGFVLQIRDDSMRHLIPKNAVVYVDKKGKIITGDLVVFRLGGETTCRLITVHDEVYILDPDTCSQEFTRQIIDRSNIPPGFELLGKVVWAEMEF